jgi:hypothetical protein
MGADEDSFPDDDYRNDEREPPGPDAEADRQDEYAHQRSQ